MAVCDVPVAVARSVVSCRGFRKVRKRAVLFVGKMKMWVPTWGSEEYDSCFFSSVFISYLFGNLPYPVIKMAYCNRRKEKCIYGLVGTPVSPRGAPHRGSLTSPPPPQAVRRS